MFTIGQRPCSARTWHPSPTCCGFSRPSDFHPERPSRPRSPSLAVRVRLVRQWPDWGMGCHHDPTKEGLHWGMKRRSRGRGGTAGIGSVKGPSRGRGATGETAWRGDLRRNTRQRARRAVRLVRDARLMTDWSSVSSTKNPPANTASFGRISLASSESRPNE
jgi:hypothetical protein